MRMQKIKRYKDFLKKQEEEDVKIKKINALKQMREQLGLKISSFKLAQGSTITDDTLDFTSIASTMTSLDVAVDEVDIFQCQYPSMGPQ